MRRLAAQFVVAMLFFGVGWLVGTAGFSAQSGGFFRLSIDAPTGDTTIKCEDGWLPEPPSSRSARGSSMASPRRYNFSLSPGGRHVFQKAF